MKRKLIIFIAILVLLFMQALPVCASDMEESTGTYVEVLFPYMGLQFELYKVASLNSSGGYTPTADFQDCPVDFNNLTGKAEILESYVHLWGMEPMATNTVGWGDFAYFEEVGSGALGRKPASRVDKTYVSARNLYSYPRVYKTGLPRL